MCVCLCVCLCVWVWVCVCVCVFSRVILLYVVIREQSFLKWVLGGPSFLKGTEGDNQIEGICLCKESNAGYALHGYTDDADIDLWLVPWNIIFYKQIPQGPLTIKVNNPTKLGF